tara:strand:+ start:1303 stop:1518 length:216 start_codon:yes stop_codon:yes gene_type:complete
MNILTVELKSIYGRDLIYPACDQSQLMAELLNVKTLSLFHIRKLRRLGYEFRSKEHSFLEGATDITLSKTY